MNSPLSFRAVFWAAIFIVPFGARHVYAQANSINLAGSGNLLSNTASSSAIIAGNTSTNGGTNSAIIGAANSIVPTGTRFAFIGAGNFNRMAAGSHSAAMLAGFSNSIAPGAVRGVIIGGGFNTNAGRSSSILGGELNVIEPLNPAYTAEGLVATFATIGGGLQNLIGSNGLAAVVGGGSFNRAKAFYATICGGADNKIEALEGMGTSAQGGTIGGGVYNEVSAAGGTIAGGGTNGVGGEGGTVAGGAYNDANGSFSTVGGGWDNGISVPPPADSTGSVIAGGLSNEITATNGIGINLEAAATISGGANNTARGFRSVIGGGGGNTNNGMYAVIPGGAGNLAAGQYSFAAGSIARATNDSSFVWGDGTTPTISTNDNTFTVRATGGVRFITSTDPNFTGTNDGVVLIPGNGAWSSLSDSNAKTAVEPVSARAILAKLASLPVSAWQYKGRPGRRFIGPMAQDFHAAFGLGSDDKTISTLDSDGVMYAAIQGLVEEIKERDEQHTRDLTARDRAISELEAKLQAVEERLNSLPPSP